MSAALRRFMQAEPYGDRLCGRQAAGAGRGQSQVASASPKKPSLELFQQPNSVWDLFDLLAWEPRHYWWSRMGKMIMLWGQKLFFFFFSGNYGRLLLGLSFIVWGPWCHGCSWEHKLLVARHQESSSFSSCSPHMELDGCRFLSDVYKILRESEVDLKALDDPFNRSRAFENWNNYNNEAMGLGLSWGRESTFCVNEDESLRNFHK